jgi:fatty acid desaturase
MIPQLLRASGYLSSFVTPALLGIAAWTDEPYLVIAVVLLAFPLARVLFGALGCQEPEAWGERVARTLDRLPIAFAIMLAAVVALLLVHFSAARPGFAAAVGWTASLWATMVFATCVAHALLHSRAKSERTVGHVLAGMCGYPLLGYEHNRHHRLAGATATAETPRLDESFWGFTGRRLGTVLPDTLGASGLALRGHPRSPTVRGLRVGIAATAATWTAFALAAGGTGIIIYGIVIVLVAIGVQLVTYLQHWGLGDDHLDLAQARDLGWEDDCRLQSWMTLNLSLHQTHHRDAARPYYRCHLAADAPRLLMFAAFVPALWNRVMMPALERWRTQPMAPLSAGRRIACVALYKRVRA